MSISSYHIHIWDWGYSEPGWMFSGSTESSLHSNNQSSSPGCSLQCAEVLRIAPLLSSMAFLMRVETGMSGMDVLFHVAEPAELQWLRWLEFKAVVISVPLGSQWEFRRGLWCHCLNFISKICLSTAQCVWWMLLYWRKIPWLWDVFT